MNIYSKIASASAGAYDQMMIDCYTPPLQKLLRETAKLSHTRRLLWLFKKILKNQKSNVRSCKKDYGHYQGFSRGHPP
jgi:hypothetical protein